MAVIQHSPLSYIARPAIGLSVIPGHTQGCHARVAVRLTSLDVLDRWVRWCSAACRFRLEQCRAHLGQQDLVRRSGTMVVSGHLQCQI